jgi:kumamolisin
MTARVIVRGTKPVAGRRQHVKLARHTETIEVLLLLRAQEAGIAEVFALGASRVCDREHLEPMELMRRLRPSDGDIQAVRDFAAAHGLEVLRVDPEGRTIELRGTVRDMNRAFSVELHHYRKDDHVYRSHEDEIRIPIELREIITGVFGLDERHVSRRARFAAGSASGLPPVDENTKHPSAFTELYAFPKDSTGKGSCVAVLAFDGGFEKPKLASYLAKLGVQTPTVIVREIGNGKNDPANQPGTLTPDVEVYMDLEIVASAAPDSTIVVYFGENTSKGWIETLRAAIFDTMHPPSVVSLSWGQAEAYWDEQTMQALDEAFQQAALLGITICCSSGDYGVFEEHEEAYTVAFPASSPHVLACGGTRLDVGTDGTTKESVWNQSDMIGMASGGGVSRVYDVPPFQSDVGTPRRPGTERSGRGIPDVAANASSLSGYMIWADDSVMSIGGTSAAAPLWAALIARLNEALGRRIGYITPLLYVDNAAGLGALRNVVEGNNRMSGQEGYDARDGWDACTGLGTPHGEKLLAWLSRESPSSK